jgi:hypothetical protein
MYLSKQNLVDDLSTIVSVGSDTESHAPKSMLSDAAGRKSYPNSPKNVSIAPKLESIPDNGDGNISPLSNDASTFFQDSNSVSNEAKSSTIPFSSSAPPTAAAPAASVVSNPSVSASSIQRSKSLKKIPSSNASVDSKRKSTGSVKAPPSKDRSLPTQKRPAMVASLTKSGSKRGSRQLSTSASSTLAVAAVVTEEGHKAIVAKKKMCTSSVPTQTGGSLLEVNSDDEDEVVSAIDSLTKRKSVEAIKELNPPAPIVTTSVKEVHHSHEPTPHHLSIAIDLKDDTPAIAPFLSPQSYVTYGSTDSCSFYELGSPVPRPQAPASAVKSARNNNLSRPTSSSKKNSFVTSPTFQSSSNTANQAKKGVSDKLPTRVSVISIDKRPMSQPGGRRTTVIPRQTIEASSMMTDTLSETASFSSPKKVSSKSSKLAQEPRPQSPFDAHVAKSTKTAKKMPGVSSVSAKNTPTQSLLHSPLRSSLRPATASAITNTEASASSTRIRDRRKSEETNAKRAIESTTESTEAVETSMAVDNGQFDKAITALESEAVLEQEPSVEPATIPPELSSPGTRSRSRSRNPSRPSTASPTPHRRLPSTSEELAASIAAAVLLVEGGDEIFPATLPATSDIPATSQMNEAKAAQTISVDNNNHPTKKTRPKKRHSKEEIEPSSAKQVAKYPILPSLPSKSKAPRKSSSSSSSPAKQPKPSKTIKNNNEDERHEARIAFLSRSVRIPRSSSSEIRYPTAFEVSRSLTVLPQITQLPSDQNSPLTEDVDRHEEKAKLNRSFSPSKLKKTSPKRLITTSPGKKRSVAQQHPLWPSTQPYESWKVLTVCDTLYCAKLIRSKLMKSVQKIQRQSLFNNTVASVAISQGQYSKLDMIQLAYGGFLDLNDLIRLRIDEKTGDAIQWVVETSSTYVWKVFFDMESDSYLDDELIRESSAKQKLLYQSLMLKANAKKDLEVDRMAAAGVSQPLGSENLDEVQAFVDAAIDSLQTDPSIPANTINAPESNTSEEVQAVVATSDLPVPVEQVQVGPVQAEAEIEPELFNTSLEHITAPPPITA